MRPPFEPLDKDEEEQNVKIEFHSKVFTGRESTGRLLRGLLLLAGGLILVIIIIKIIAKDFHMRDYGGILFSLFLIWKGNMRGKAVPQYSYADGEIEFEEERLTIRYRNMVSKKEDKRFADAVISYGDIENIEYGEALQCYHFVIRSGSKEDKEHIFMYVLDPEEEQVIRKNIRRYTGFLVRVMEDGRE